MKRIGIVVPELGSSGGVTTVAKFILEAVRSTGRFDVKLVSLAMGSRDRCSTQILKPSSWGGPRIEERVWGDERYSHVGCWFSEFEFQRYRARRILKDLLDDCDIIQVVSGSPAPALAVTGIGKPVALQVATRAVVERRRTIRQTSLVAFWRRIMTAVTNVFDDSALRNASAVFVENDWMYSYVQAVRKNIDSLVIYAPPGVNTRIFKPSENRLSAADPDDRYILTVGRFDDPRKNIEMLLEAYALVVKMLVSPPRLILAGATKPPKAFVVRMQELDLSKHVEIRTGVSVDDLLRLYQSACCFALSSDEEGLGLVLIEAMACGVPAIATRCGGPDGIISDGIDGFLVPIDDHNSLAARIAELCSSAEKNAVMGRNARAKVEAKFEWATQADKFTSTYDRMLMNTHHDTVR